MGSFFLPETVRIEKKINNAAKRRDIWIHQRLRE